MVVQQRQKCNLREKCHFQSIARITISDELYSFSIAYLESKMSLTSCFLILNLRNLCNRRLVASIFIWEKKLQGSYELCELFHALCRHVIGMPAYIVKIVGGLRVNYLSLFLPAFALLTLCKFLIVAAIEKHANLRGKERELSRHFRSLDALFPHFVHPSSVA